VGGAALARRSAVPYPLYLVDPSVQWRLADDERGRAVRYSGPPAAGWYRYAVIQGGRVSIHEGDRARR
jgi:hypothetical protein